MDKGVPDWRFPENMCVIGIYFLRGCQTTIRERAAHGRRGNAFSAIEMARHPGRTPKQNSQFWALIFLWCKSKWIDSWDPLRSLGLGASCGTSPARPGNLGLHGLQGQRPRLAASPKVCGDRGCTGDVALLEGSGKKSKKARSV